MTARQLKTKRKAACLTQDELSRATGIGQPHISEYECGNRKMKPYVEKLFELFFNGKDKDYG